MNDVTPEEHLVAFILHEISHVPRSVYRLSAWCNSGKDRVARLDECDLLRIKIGTHRRTGLLDGRAQGRRLAGMIFPRYKIFEIPSIDMHRSIGKLPHASNGKSA